jgi:N utilization substance protein A
LLRPLGRRSCGEWQFSKGKVGRSVRKRVGDVVFFLAHHVDKGNVYMEIENTEALLPARQRIHRQQYSLGDRVRCLLLKLNTDFFDADIILSRGGVNRVCRLLGINTSEIADGNLFLRGIGRARRIG